MNKYSRYVQIIVCNFLNTCVIITWTPEQLPIVANELQDNSRICPRQLQESTTTQST
jgi:hypothetical protein